MQHRLSGEQIQRAFPTAHVVKSLNTVTAAVMADPSIIPGVHDMFVSGNDAKAKAQVINLLKTGFGWKEVIDLGDIGGRALRKCCPGAVGETAYEASDAQRVRPRRALSATMRH